MREHTAARLPLAGSFAIAACLALAPLACEEPATEHPLACWYRPHSHGYLSSTACTQELCTPTGNGDEILCSCLGTGCECDVVAHPEIPLDGSQNPFACFWALETCYEGAPGQFATGARGCDCYGGFYCWMQCEGRITKDGRRMCMADGSEVECLPEPPQDEAGKAVLCRFGATPVPWPLPD